MTDCWKCMVGGQEIPKTNAPPEYFRPSLASPSRTGDPRATDGEWIPQDAIEIISSDRPGGGMKSCGACRDSDSGQFRFRGNYFDNKTGCDFGDGDTWVNGTIAQGSAYTLACETVEGTGTTAAELAAIEAEAAATLAAEQLSARCIQKGLPRTCTQADIDAWYVTQLQEQEAAAAAATALETACNESAEDSIMCVIPGTPVTPLSNSLSVPATYAPTCDWSESDLEETSGRKNCGVCLEDGALKSCSEYGDHPSGGTMCRRYAKDRCDEGDGEEWINGWLVSTPGFVPANMDLINGLELCSRDHVGQCVIEEMLSEWNANSPSSDGDGDGDGGGDGDGEGDGDGGSNGSSSSSGEDQEFIDEYFYHIAGGLVGCGIVVLLLIFLAKKNK